MARRQFIFLVFIFLAFAKPVLAHNLPQSELELDLAAGEVNVKLVSHVADFGDLLHLPVFDRLYDPAFLAMEREPLQALIAQYLQIASDGKPLSLSLIDVAPDLQSKSLVIHLQSSWSQNPGILHISVEPFSYDPRHQTLVFVRESGSAFDQEILTKNKTAFDYFTGSREGIRAVIRKFVSLGIWHIFIGPDHILFILGLLLAVRRFKKLLILVTAFTFAHSLTLALATLNILRFPSHWIEPLIALSVICVGANNLLTRSAKKDARVLIAFCFGLIHGFGFAGVLQEFALSRVALGWSLFSFNIGVEMGQLCVVLTVIPCLVLIKKWSESIYQKIVIAGSLAVVAMGSVWLMERIFFS